MPTLKAQLLRIALRWQPATLEKGTPSWASATPNFPAALPLGEGLPLIQGEAIGHYLVRGIDASVSIPTDRHPSPEAIRMTKPRTAPVGLRKNRTFLRARRVQ